LQAYLIETRSILGLSGSPVCITIPPTRVANGKLELLDTGTGAICIGMMLGYHLSASSEDEIVVPTMQQSPKSKAQENKKLDGLSLDERNTGFAVVLPIERLFDVMETDAMKKVMDQAIDKAKGRVRPAGAPIVGADLPADDANPNHREDFMRLEALAVKKPERED
jgi:hypothetical protein